VVVITARIYTTEVTPLKEIYRRKLRSKRQPDLSGVCFVAGTGELAHEVRCHKKNDRALCSVVAVCRSDSGGMVGFCVRRAQRALFQTHSALTDAVFYTKISRLKHARYCSYFYDAT